MTTNRGTKVFGTAAVTAAAALLLSACLLTRASSTQTISPPDPAATGFGSAFSMDEDRAVVRAVVGGVPVVYVYGATGSGWQHESTITAPFGATAAWGRSVAVSGEVVAVADPAREVDAGFDAYGVVSLYRWTGTEWTVLQNIRSGREWDPFAAGVWLSDAGLVVASSMTCDGSCSDGAWTLYHRYGGIYREVFRTAPGIDVSVGVDAGRFAVGVPGEFGITSWGYDNTLRVIDANVTLPRFLLDETVPFHDGGPETTRLFRKVDLSGDVLAYESCCTSDDRLHIRRFDGTTYQPEATFPLDEESAGVVALGDVVLVADADDGVFHAYAHVEGTWKRSSDLKVPAGAGGFAVAPVGVGDEVAVAGDGVVHVLTVEVVELEG